MTERSFRFWRRWFVAASVATAMFGVVCALGSASPFFDWFNVPIARNFLGTPEFPPDVGRFREWLCGVLGATIAGWGTCFAFLGVYPFARRERWVRTCIAASLAAWAPLDTALSIYFGALVNVVFNLLALALIAPPLVATWREFSR